MQACHPSLKGSRDLQLFLETSEDEFAHEVARAHMEQGSATKKTLASTLQLFKDIGHHTANLMSGKLDDEEEDPDYIKVLLKGEYLGQSTLNGQDLPCVYPAKSVLSLVTFCRR